MARLVKVLIRDSTVLQQLDVEEVCGIVQLREGLLVQ
jgi:hypothetical protein